jgi:hypothetical protein
VGAHAAAALAAYLVLPSLAGALLASALVALGAAAARSRALLKAAGSVRAIEIGGQEPAFVLADGARLTAPIGTRRYVSRYMVALPVGKPLARTLLVTADMLSAPEFRRLRLWALWNRLPGVAAAQLAA